MAIDVPKSRRLRVLDRVHYCDRRRTFVVWMPGLGILVVRRAPAEKKRCTYAGCKCPAQAGYRFCAPHKIKTIRDMHESGYLTELPPRTPCFNAGSWGSHVLDDHDTIEYRLD